MAVKGGRIPFDEVNALSGPCRFLWADAAVATVPGDLWDIVPAVANASGLYPPKTNWNDFGLSADAPQYTTGHDTEGLEFESTAATLFETVSEITRSVTAQIAEISPENLRIIENAPAVASAIAASGTGATGESALKKLSFGAYDTLKRYRIAVIAFRPVGAGTVVEPAPSLLGSRPPAVALVLPQVTLAAEDIDLEIAREDPVNAEVEFSVFAEPSLPSGQDSGFWIFEQPGTIA